MNWPDVLLVAALAALGSLGVAVAAGWWLYRRSTEDMQSADVWDHRARHVATLYVARGPGLEHLGPVEWTAFCSRLFAAANQAAAVRRVSGPWPGDPDPDYQVRYEDGQFDDLEHHRLGVRLCRVSDCELFLWVGPREVDLRSDAPIRVRADAHPLEEVRTR